MRTAPASRRGRFGELPFALKRCLAPGMSSDRDSLVPAQPRWLDPLVSTRSLETTLRTRHACPLVAPERNGPDRYTHRLDIPRPLAQEFLPVASTWRNWRRNVRKNQSVDETEIVPGRSFCIRLATTNSGNPTGKIEARYSRWRVERSSASPRIAPVRAQPD